MLSLRPDVLLATLFVSSAGFVLFRYGRKQRRFPQLAIGIVMMLYPIVVSDVGIVLAICAALFGLLWLAVRMGF